MRRKNGAFDILQIPVCALCLMLLLDGIENGNSVINSSRIFNNDSVLGQQNSKFYNYEMIITIQRIERMNSSDGYYAANDDLYHFIKNYQLFPLK